MQELDEKEYALDFNLLDPIRDYLRDRFDHKVVVSSDDPELETFRDLGEKGIIDLSICDGVGLEKFAEQIWHCVSGYVHDNNLVPRVMIRTVEVREHQGNSHLFLF